jgi:hypothetical protein
MLSTCSNAAHRTVHEESREVEDWKVLASILAAGYRRYRRRRKDSLDVAANLSLHGYEVNALEKEGLDSDADSASQRD